MLLLVLVLFVACGQTSSTTKLAGQVNTDVCDNPDASISCCFINIPQNLQSVMQIRKSNEPGDPLTISGTVLKSDGKTPWPDVIIYAYQTDNTGHYSKSGNEKGIQKWHGRLHGWCKTDVNGRYEIRTIRPAPYPGNTIPAHIHAAFKLPDGSEPFYINDFVFKDDPLIDQRYVSSLGNRGGNGIVELTRADGVWKGSRDIVLSK